MNITIKLTAEQVKAVKQYLKDLGDENVTNEQVKEELKSRAYGAIFNPAEALSDYLKEAV